METKILPADVLEIVNKCYKQATGQEPQEPKEKRDAYDIVGEKVEEYWKQNYPQDVIAFFEQKYSWEDSWDKEEELVHAVSDNSYDMEFENDFCEGQTDVRNITIVPLHEVCQLYRDRIIDPLSFIRGSDSNE